MNSPKRHLGLRAVVVNVLGAPSNAHIFEGSLDGC